MASHPDATPGSVLGPFHTVGSPWLDNPANLIGANPGEVVRAARPGARRDGQPLPEATLDYWQNAANGLYWQVDPAQPQRQPALPDAGAMPTAASRSRRSGRCPTRSRPTARSGATWSSRPVADRWRSAHAHVIVSAPGHRTLVTELFDAEDPYLDNDAVFGVREALIGRYEPIADRRLCQRLGLAGDSCPVMQFDISLAPAGAVRHRRRPDAADRHIRVTYRAAPIPATHHRRQAMKTIDHPAVLGPWPWPSPSAWRWRQPAGARADDDQPDGGRRLSAQVPVDQGVHRLLHPRSRQAPGQGQQVQDPLEPGLGRPDRQAQRRARRHPEGPGRHRHRHHRHLRRQDEHPGGGLCHAVRHQRPGAGLAHHRRDGEQVPGHQEDLRLVQPGLPDQLGGARQLPGVHQAGGQVAGRPEGPEDLRRRLQPALPGAGRAPSASPAR